MTTALKSDLRSKTFCIRNSYPLLVEKENRLDNAKFYQKLFVFLISFSIILIFPESPRELGNICGFYHPIKICNVW